MCKMYKFGTYQQNISSLQLSTKIYIKRLQKRLIMLITRLITYFVDKKMAKNMLITNVNNFQVKKGRKYQNDGFIVQNIQNGL